MLQDVDIALTNLLLLLPLRVSQLELLNDLGVLGLLGPLVLLVLPAQLLQLGGVRLLQRGELSLVSGHAPLQLRLVVVLGVGQGRLVLALN